MTELLHLDPDTPKESLEVYKSVEDKISWKIKIEGLDTEKIYKIHLDLKGKFGYNSDKMKKERASP